MAICKQDGGLCGVGGYCDDCTADEDVDVCCYDCRHPIERTDDALVCIQCGGMNKRKRTDQ